MLVVATGIPCTVEETYCNALESFASGEGTDLKFFQSGKELFRTADERRIKLDPKNILFADHKKLDLIRTLSLSRSDKKIYARERRGFQSVDILRTHAKFIHDEVPRRAWFTKDILAQKPDAFVTFVDDAPAILERLNRSEQWARNKFTLKDILFWMVDEVSTTRDWSVSAGKPFWVVPIVAPSRFLYRALMRPDIELVYASMPLTFAYDPATMKKIDDLIHFLNLYFNMMDPRWFKPLAASKGEYYNRTVFRNVVNRDLDWLVNQASRVIAYFPKLVLSPGLIIEIFEAFRDTKDTWLIWPDRKHISPFAEGFAHQLFYNIPDMKHYVEKRFKKVG